ncbi:MAG: 50S ribosomal protein L22 [Solirubrobacterales bacterium]|nr:50S ribosomal protein L22 [Solirubrobacterales bacterium]
MSPAPKKPTEEEVEKAKAKADEAFIKEQDAKQEEADARETAKAQVEAEGESTETEEVAPSTEPAAKAVPEGEDGPRAAADAAVAAPADADELAGAKPAKRRRATPEITVSAHAKYVRTSARKARIVCDHIRGKDVEQARAILAFTPRGVAEAWSKLLESAVANAEHNHELVGDELRVASVHADEGPTLKRFRPRAMGRATQLRKRTSHLTILLTQKD